MSIRDPGTDVRSDEIALPAGRDESASREEMPEVRARVEEEAARLQGLNRSLHFRVHEDSGQLLVQVVDRRTGEILRESPPEDFLELAVRLREMVGAFLDQTT